jgi:hypothetical protein
MPVETEGSVRSTVQGSLGPENVAVVASGMFHAESAEKGQSTGSREVGKENALALRWPASYANPPARTRLTHTFSNPMDGRFMVRASF